MESQDVLVTRACILLHPSAVCTRLVLIGVTWLQEALYVFYSILFYFECTFWEFGRYLYENAIFFCFHRCSSASTTTTIKASAIILPSTCRLCSNHRLYKRTGLGDLSLLSFQTGSRNPIEKSYRNPIDFH